MSQARRLILVAGLWQNTEINAGLVESEKLKNLIFNPKNTETAG